MTNVTLQGMLSDSLSTVGYWYGSYLYLESDMVPDFTDALNEAV